MNKITILLILISSLLLSSEMTNSIKKFTTAYEMNYDKNTTGVVRQLKIYKHPNWVAKIELTDGKNIFFSSPKSMFEFYYRPANWSFLNLNLKSEKDFKQILVTDFNTLKPINAKGAFFVYGTNATSPAGDDLVAFSSYDKAEKFSKAHNGKRIFSFKEVSNPLINLLNGKI
ncbi:MAG: nitrous oxide reductase accessory protein NosL [Sulfurovum sp.]